ALLDQALQSGPRRQIVPAVARALARGAEILEGVRAARVAGLGGASARGGVPLWPLSAGEPGALRERALGLVRGLSMGEKPATDLLSDGDLASLRGRTVFREQVARAGLDKRYAGVWQTDTTVEGEGPHGLSSEAHLERCRELAAKGYRPAALSVAVLTS